MSADGTNINGPADNRDNSGVSAASANRAPRGGKPWPKGQSGNRSGRPKTLVELEREIRNAYGPRLMPLLASLYDKALEGDTQACQVILDRVLGKAGARKESLVAVPVVSCMSAEEVRQRALDALGTHGARLAATAAVRELSDDEVRAATAIAQVTTASVALEEKTGIAATAGMSRDHVAAEMLTRLKEWGYVK